MHFARTAKTILWCYVPLLKHAFTQRHVCAVSAVYDIPLLCWTATISTIPNSLDPSFQQRLRLLSRGLCCHSHWFGLALLPLSLACHAVCQNINRMHSIDFVLIMSHISTEERLFCNNYPFKSRSLNYEVTFSCWWF